MKKAFAIIIAFALSLVSARAQEKVESVVLSGSVIDAVTKEPKTAFILVKDADGNLVTATRSNGFENGYYSVSGLRPGFTYAILIKKPKYFLEKYKLFIPNKSHEQISKDFVIKPLYEGAKIALSVPPFELNKSKLRFGADYVLDNYAQTLLNNPNVDIEIQSYPDNDADKTKNFKLTSERCKSLINYFISKGVDPSRLTAQAFDSVDPDNPPPKTKRAKGKRYIGTTYLVVKKINKK